MSVNSARSKARDAKRKADVHQIWLAISQYIVDNNVTISRPPGTPNLFMQINNQCPAWKLDTQIAPQYIPQVPEDPSNPGPPPQCVATYDYWYYYGAGYKLSGSTITNPASSDTFVICSLLENASDKDYKTIPSPWGPAVNYCQGN